MFTCPRFVPGSTATIYTHHQETQSIPGKTKPASLIVVQVTTNILKE